MKYRQTLLDFFGDIDKLCKQIKSTSADKSIATRILADNIYFSTIQFLQLHLFTLQLLPSPKKISYQSKSLVMSAQDQMSIERLRKEMNALMEQRFQLEKSLVETTSKRKFEDAQMLKESLDEIITEIVRKKRELEEYGENDS